MAVDLDIVGNAAVDVIPIAPGFHEKLKAIVLPGMDRLGEEIGAIIGRAMAPKIAEAIPKAVSDGARLARADAVRQGSSTGGAFADSLRAKLTAAFRAMPKLDIKLSDTGVDAQLARLRAKLEDLRNKRIGIDISAEDADAKLTEIDARLARLGASSPNVAVRVDTATARAAIAEIRAEIAEASRNPLDIRVRVGAFRENLIAQVKAAEEALPAIEINADTDEARQELDRYRAELAAIPVRVHTDADFDDAAALVKIEELRIQLDRLAARRVSVDVRADASRAAAELGVVLAEAEALDAKRVGLHIDSGGAQHAVLALAVALASLVAPALPVIAAGAGAVAASFTAAGAAVGAFTLAALPGLKNVSAALQAQTAAQNQSTKATSAQANAGNIAAQQALQMASAQQALASARRSAAQQIANAEAGVTSAERSLADAQKAEKQAQEDLTDARKTAAEQLASLGSQLANSALDQRAAQLAVDEAKAALDAANDPKNKNTDLRRRQAQLDYDTAVQRLKDQTKKTDDLTKSAAAQRKAGIEGSQVVKDAENKLASAHRNTADQAAALAKAQKAVGDAQLQAADSIRSAERGIASARLSASKVTVQAATKEDAYQKALKKLTPSARELFDAIAGPRGLKTAFSDWSKTLQPEVLPLFTRGVDSAKASLPGLTPLVLAAADGIGTLFDKASQELKSPFWQGFKDDIKTSAEPAIVGLGVAFGNVFKGMAGIVDAFLPHMTGIAANMDRITGRFANWGSNLKGSPGFEAFLDYVKENGPKVAEYIGQILTIVTDVARDIQPVTEAFLGPLLTDLAWIATNMPEIVQLFYAMYLGSKLFALGMVALSFATGIYDTVMALAGLETWGFAAALAATGISELILLIVAAIVILGLAIYELWTRAGWFRDGLKAAWKAIEIAAVWLWKAVIKPTAKYIGDAFVAMGDAAVWLWKNAIKPAFDAIWYAARFLVTAVLTLLVTPVYLAIKYVLAPVFLWLWTNAVKPSFDAIATAAGWLWTKVLKPVFDAVGRAGMAVYTESLKPAFDGMKILFRDLGVAADAVWKNVIKPTFGFIGDKASWLYHTALKPPFDLIKTAVGQVANAFTSAKDGIDKSWSKLADIAKKPVKFIVSTVYNKGIVPVWNAIAKVTQVDQLHTLDLKGWATGGILPGYTPGSDPHEFYSPTGGRIALSGGEAIMRPEFTRAVGSGFVNYFNRVAATQGVAGVRNALGGRRAYAGGGIIGTIGDAIGGNLTLLDRATGGLGFSDYLTNPAKVWDALLKTVKGQVAGIGDSPWAKMIGKLPLAMVNGLKETALGTVKGLLGDNGPGFIGVGGFRYSEYNDTILQALQLLGQPAAYLGITQDRMMKESGGNPTAVNLWDSNAKAGHPSVGLMQIIEGTFRRYAGPFLHTGPFAYGVSENPLAQFYTAMRYALSRYGSLPAAFNRPGGYDNGGYLPTGTSLVYNHTGHPEPVFTRQQFADIRANAERGSGPSTVNADVRVYVGDQEITDIVRTEIDLHDANTAFDIGNGRRF